MPLKSTRDRRHTAAAPPTPGGPVARLMPPPPSLGGAGVPGWVSLLPVWLSRARHRPAIVAAMSGTANNDTRRPAEVANDDTPATCQDPDTRQR